MLNRPLFELGEDETGGPAFFWVNPWDGKRERVASLWWPTHPPEKTEEVERIFSGLCLIADLEEAIKAAMQDAWNEICSDTGCHPDDIKHGRGKYLEFEPGHWARAVAMHLRSATTRARHDHNI